MRRWLVAALPLWIVLEGVVAACSGPATTPDLASPVGAPRPTPSASAGPTPSLPVARPIGSPSAVTANGSPQPLSQAAGGFGGSAFVLQSTAFTDGSQLPSDFTCDGSDQAPPLSWASPPPSTAAYALIEEDADANAGANAGASATPFVQWLLYNMPKTVTQLAAGTPAKPLLSNGAQQGLNSNQTLGYLGPCPSVGESPHHYTFLLFALDGYVTLETGASVDVVQDALSGHTIGQTQLTVTFKR